MWNAWAKLGIGLSAMVRAGSCLAESTEPGRGMADAAAQAAIEAGGDDAEIIVTGTLVRGIAPVGKAVIGLSRNEVEQTGASTTTQLLQTVPQLGSFNTLQFPLDATGNRVATNRPNLRLLPGEAAGGGTTLVLIDGHRVVGMGIQQTSPDPDIIPPGMIERIEIVPDGGSSIYGSDAVGGVINFVTRKSFKGLELNARTGGAANYRTFDANATAGTAWDSGSALISYNHSQHDALFGRNRDFVRLFPSNLGGVPFPVTGIRCAPGNVRLRSTGAIHALPYTTGTAQPNSANQCDETDGPAFYPREHRHSVMARARQELGESIALDLSGFYTNRSTYQPQGPFRTSVLIGPAALGLTPSPFQASHRLTANAVEGHEVSVAWGDSDSTYADRKLETWGVAATLTADLGGGWELRALASHGRSRTESHALHFSSIAPANAIRAGLFNPYDPLASDPAGLAVAGGPEIFGLGVQRLTDARLTLDGDVLRLPGGPVKLAAGVEYLDERLRSQIGTTLPGFQDSGYPGLSLPANLPGNPLTEIIAPIAPLPVVRQGRNVKAAFGELVIPLFGKDNSMPGIEELTLSASARYDRYSDFGGTFNPRIGATWRPLDWIRLRGSWSRSFVAPSLADHPDADLTQVLGFTGSAFANFFTPPLDLVANGTWPAVRADQTYVLTVSGSAPAIRPMRAESWSLGLDLEPPFVPGLKLGATYWNIRYSGVIAVPPIAFRQGFWLRFGSLITVNPTQAQLDAVLAAADVANNLCAPQPGCFYAILDGRKRNAGIFKLDGLDFAASYNRPTGFGSIDASLNGNYELNRRQAPIPGSPFVDFLAMGASRFKAQASLGAQVGRFRAQATLLHTGGYSLQMPVGIAPQQTRVGSFSVVNLFLRYDLPEAGALRGLTFTLSIDNLFNRDPPEYRNTLGFFGYTNGNTLGRLVQFGVSKKF